MEIPTKCPKCGSNDLEIAVETRILMVYDKGQLITLDKDANSESITVTCYDCDYKTVNDE